MITARLNWVSRAHVPVGVALGATLAAILAVYADTARSIVAIWNSSETFAHGYLILPISLWLIWRRREELACIPARPFWPALVLLAACGCAWFLAELGGVQVVRQYAFVAMLPLAVLAVTGQEMTRAIGFPLAFLLLAVPFGEVFTAPLINFTADFTVAALRLAGVPVLRNGSNFEIPSGSWSVVEACSGVRYLISSFTLGCLYAYLSYRSITRRLIFVMLSIAVPIFANGVRAYLIVMIGHLSSNQFAVGVDHLIYGWLFFGLVMFLMFCIGNRWRDAEKVLPAAAEKAVQDRSGPREQTHHLMTAAAVALACIAAWPSYAMFLDAASAAAQEPSFPVETQWQTTKQFTDWKPAFQRADQELSRFLEKDGRQLAIVVLTYTGGKDKPRLISSANKLVTDEGGHWRQIQPGERVEVDGIEWREAVIQQRDQVLQVWSGYLVDGRFTVSDYAGKVLQVKQKLLMRGNAGVALFFVTPYGGSREEGRQTLQQFLNDNTAWGTSLTVHQERS